VIESRIWIAVRAIVRAVLGVVAAIELVVEISQEALVANAAPALLGEADQLVVVRRGPVAREAHRVWVAAASEVVAGEAAADEVAVVAVEAAEVVDGNQEL
jgi:hypothetical protein